MTDLESSVSELSKSVNKTTLAQLHQKLSSFQLKAYEIKIKTPGIISGDTIISGNTIISGILS